MNPDPSMHRILLLLFNSFGLMSSLVPPVEAAFRSFDFDAHVKYAPLLHSLVNHTAIYHKWPPKKLRKTLPNFISAALITTGGNNDNDDNKNDDLLPLVGPPIHVQVGDTLSVSLKNSISTTGLSLHWHGFEMTNALEYDGVVGVTQCPISPSSKFVYEFVVEESPGTYWWHTHSGTLGIHAINAIHGPLIVHPEGEEKKQLVDNLNSYAVANSLASAEDASMGDANTPWYYGNERILFFKDGFVHSEAIMVEKSMGGLNEAVSVDDRGYTVGSEAWEFGTCNGGMREIVPVSAGKTYRFRLINGGVHYGLRINIADLKMKVIAADSEPVEPLVVDEVFIHVAERFDVEVTIPKDWAEGDSFWIRADSAESTHQGYQNGIRAILSVIADDSGSTKTDAVLFSHKKGVHDPEANIRSPIVRNDDHVTLNCFEKESFGEFSPGGRCLQITKLSQSKTSNERRMQSYTEEEAEVHFIDSHFQPPPQFSHFMRLDDGPFYQHVNPLKSMLDPSFQQDDMHPNAAVLHVPAFSTVILVWRTTSLMDHPMHLHGLKMQILDIAIPNKREDCTLSQCKLNSLYKSHEDIRALASSIPPSKAVLKDTFIIPAGGAVVTRIHTHGPSLWYSHCHLELHHIDGMAFILNVGNYAGSLGRTQLPTDYPSCDSPFVQTQIQYPSCDCYKNPNTILGNQLNSDYKCSRAHLCHHVKSRAANLEKYTFPGGDDISSKYRIIPGWGISFITVFVVCLVLSLVRWIVGWAHLREEREKMLDGTRTTMIKVDESVNLPTTMPASEDTNSTVPVKSIGESDRDSEHSADPKFALPPKNVSRALSWYGPTNPPISDSIQQPATHSSRRDILQTFKTASARSWRLGSSGVSAASYASSSRNLSSVDAEFLLRHKEGSRKDFMMTYDNVSGSSWADCGASGTQSDEQNMRSSRHSRASMQIPTVQSIELKVKKDDINSKRGTTSNIVSDIAMPSPVTVQRDSTNSASSLFSSLYELEEDPKFNSQSLAPSLDGGENEPNTYEPKSTRKRPTDNASDLGEPPKLPKRSNSAILDHLPQAQSGTKPSRKVSFNLGLKEEKRDDSFIIETATVSERVSDLSRRPSILTPMCASVPFSEQLKHIVFTQYEIYRPLCKCWKLPVTIFI
mmetsp:Transcript_29962/g.55135  ORF Transcript_29962/g.55135 Transcript_29962/m.55135 type:complete len:1142 (-) Transcript_29962:1277-4702(-)